MYVKLNNNNEITEILEKEEPGSVNVSTVFDENNIKVKDQKGSLVCNRYKYVDNILTENRVRVLPVLAENFTDITTHIVIDQFSLDKLSADKDGLYTAPNGSKYADVDFNYRGNELDEYGNSNYKYQDGVVIEAQFDIVKYKSDVLTKLENKSYSGLKNIIVNKFFIDNLAGHDEYRIQRKIENILAGKSKRLTQKSYNDTVNAFISAFGLVENSVAASSTKEEVDMAILSWNPPQDFI